LRKGGPGNRGKGGRGAAMTEAEWLTSNEPLAMLAHLGRRLGVRKQRLLACACARLAWDSLGPAGRAAVEFAERLADGRVGERRWLAVWRAANKAWLRAPEEGREAAALAESTVLETVQEALSRGLVGRRSPGFRQGALVRELYGNPFRPVAADDAWRRPAMQAFARRVYREREFTALPIFADALEDAGCAAAAVLEHFRGPGRHFRGCWALDLVLGKE
jgi:hypothetical protein